MSRSTPLFNCLIRTHHITSRKKLRRVRKAASQLDVEWVLVRSGGSPGLMYGESREPARLTDWVASVQALRYKDFRCVSKPGPVSPSPSPSTFPSPSASSSVDSASISGSASNPGGKTTCTPVTPSAHLPAVGFHETTSLLEFSKEMEKRGLIKWWRKAMSYE